MEIRIRPARILCHKNYINRTIDEITQRQTARGIFANIAVKPYRGKKYNPGEYCWIVIG